jgi:hypothetical protein
MKVASGLICFVAAIIGYSTTGGTWWGFALGFFVPVVVWDAIKKFTSGFRRKN